MVKTLLAGERVSLFASGRTVAPSSRLQQLYRVHLGERFRDLNHVVKSVEEAVLVFDTEIESVHLLGEYLEVKTYLPLDDADQEILAGLVGGQFE